MAEGLVLVDTSILIDYFRKSNKATSKWIGLFDKGYDFVISAITHYEIYCGANEAQLAFWAEILNDVDVLQFDDRTAKIAVDMNNELKKRSKQIGIADLFIAATAISNNLPLSTLNVKHFERIFNLKIIS